MKKHMNRQSNGQSNGVARSPVHTSHDRALGPEDTATMRAIVAPFDQLRTDIATLSAQIRKCELQRNALVDQLAASEQKTIDELVRIAQGWGVDLNKNRVTINFKTMAVTIVSTS